MKILFIGMNARYSLAHVKKLHHEWEITAIVEAAARGTNPQPSQNPWWKSYLGIFAKVHRIAYLCTGKLSSSEMEEYIRSTGCDLICVASCSQLIKENIINIPRLGVVNSHPSLLPQYRGGNPTYWIFYNMEKQGGHTIHYIDAGEDTGDILLQREFAIPFGVSFHAYDKKCRQMGSAMMVEVVEQIENGTARPQKQEVVAPLKKGKRCAPEDYQIDWKSWETKRAYHFIRGTDYWSSMMPNGCRYYKAVGISDRKPHHKKYVECKDGYVVLANSLSMKRCIKKALRVLLCR